MAITVTAVNDAPVFALPGPQVTPRPTPLPFSPAQGNAIRLSDVDAGTAPIRLTLTTQGAARNGTLTFGSTAGLTMTSGTGTADTTVVLQGTQADLNAALDTLVFTATGNGAANIVLTADDLGSSGAGGARQTTATVAITVSNNSKPVLTMTQTSRSYTENATPLALDPGVLVTDADNPTQASATVAIVAGHAGAEDLLAFTADPATTGNIAGSYSAGVLTLTSDRQTATLAQWQAALRSVTYSNTSDAPSTAQRTIELSIYDGIAESAMRTVMVGVVSVNDAPVLTGANDLATIAEDQTGNPGTPVSTLLAGRISDADAVSLPGIAITAVDTSHGAWQYTRNGGTSWSAVGTVGGSSALLLAADAATAVRFVPAANWNGTLASALTFRAWDGSSGSAGTKVNPGAGGGTSAFSSVVGISAITVTPVNDAPVTAMPIADRAATQDVGCAFTLPAGSFTDVDSGDTPPDTLAYAARLTSGAALPSWLAFDAATRTFSGTPANADVGSFSVRVTATDGFGVPASSTFRLTVANVNDAPVLAAAIADQAAAQGSAFAFALPSDTFTDPDVDIASGDALGYSARLASGAALPSWLAFDAATQTFRGTPANADVGSLAVRVTATDSFGLAAQDDFRLDIANVNDAPVLAAPIADRVAVQDAAFSFILPPGTFGDPDIDIASGDSLGYSARLASGAALPAWLTFDAATQTFAGTPANADVGSLAIRVTATDSFGLQAQDDFRLAVSTSTTCRCSPRRSPTRPPRKAPPSPSRCRRAPSPTPMSTSPAAMRSATRPASRRARRCRHGSRSTPPRGPSAARRPMPTSAASRFASPPPTVSAPRPAATSASPSPTSTMRPCSPRRSPTRPPRKARPSPSRCRRAPSPTPMSTSPAAMRSATRPASRRARRCRRGWLRRRHADLPRHAGQRRRRQPRRPRHRHRQFRRLGQRRLPPRRRQRQRCARARHADRRPGHRAGRGLRLRAAAGTFTDPDVDIASGDALGYAARLTSGAALPSWLTFDAATRTFSGTPANADVGSLALRVTATDSFGLAAQDDFVLAIANVNDAPLLAVPIADQAASQGSVFSFTLPSATFDDPDVDIASGDALGYAARLTSGAALPSWLAFDAATRTFSGMPANADVGSLVVRMTATDSFGLAAQSDFRLTVANVNDAPVLAAPIADQATAQGSRFAFTLPPGTFTDIDAGDTLTLAARLASGAPLPQWLGFDAATRTFGGTPGNDDVGSLAIRVTATDAAGASAHGDFRLAVANVNDAPVLAARVADQATAQGARFAFALPAGTFKDIDVGDTLAYTARLASGAPLPAWLTFDDRHLSFAGTPAAGDVGTVAIRLTATDTSGATAQTQFALVVFVPPTTGMPTVLVPIEPAAIVAAQTAAGSLPVAAPAAATTAAAPIQARLQVTPAVVSTAAPMMLLDDTSIAPKAEPLAEPQRRPAADVLAVAHPASRADAVLADAVVPQFAGLSTTPLGALLGSDDLLRKFDEVQRQMLQESTRHQTMVASSIAVSGGISISYAIWLVRGGVLASSMLSALPAWQMIDPLPVLTASRGRRSDRDTPDDPEVERLFDKPAARPAVPVAPPAEMSAKLNRALPRSV